MTMELEEFELSEQPGPGQMLVEARTTAISAGTEVANYRGITTQRKDVADWRANPYRPGRRVAVDLHRLPHRAVMPNPPPRARGAVARGTL